MILTGGVNYYHIIKIKILYSPHYGCLDDILPVFIHSLQDISRFGLRFSFDRLVEIDTDLLRFEAYNGLCYAD